MSKFYDEWNKNNFSVYKSEEKTVLKLVEKMNDFNGELAKGIDGKTDVNGDHKGTWQGLSKPTLSEEGMRATVEQHISKITDLENNFNTLSTDVFNELNTNFSNLNSEVNQNFNTQKNEVDNSIEDIKKITGNGLVYLENKNTNHFGGYGYSSFCSGATIQGKEIYVVRNGKSHYSTDETSKLVFYIKENNNFIPKIITLLGHVGDFRDPHLSINASGNKLYLTCACKYGDIHKSYVWELDHNLNVVTQGLFLGDFFVWGNVVNDTTGKPIFSGYTSNGIVVVTSSSSTLTSGTVFTSQEIIKNDGTLKATEPCLFYHGSKLKIIYRNNIGNSGTIETTDLTGLTGWVNKRLISSLGRMEAPKVLQYIPGNEPIRIVGSKRIGDDRRVTACMLVDDFNATAGTIIGNAKGGGYNSLVKTNKGYGILFYVEWGTEGTDLIYTNIEDYHFGNSIFWDWKKSLT